MGYMTSQYRRVAPARIEDRVTDRHPVLLQRASVRKHASKPVEARLVDLSVYGCHLDTDDIHNIGERLWVRFAGGNPIAATAIWCEGGRLGCRFDDVIDRDLFRSLTLLTD